jgi:hypothetical protein
MLDPNRRPRRRRPSPGTVLGLTALVVAFSSAAYAAIPSTDGSIKGCYATTDDLLLGIPHSKGDTRIVDAAEACRPYERAISWNQAGTPGLPGANGTNGTNGINGTNGVSGYEVKTASATGSATVICPGGKKALGGGASVLGAIGPGSALISSNRLSTTEGDAWSAAAADLTRTIQVTVICASMAP